MWEPLQFCQHFDVTWLTSHLCRCNECGKLGHWYEDGFVLWSRGMVTFEDTLRHTA